MWIIKYISFFIIILIINIGFSYIYLKEKRENSIKCINILEMGTDSRFYIDKNYKNNKDLKYNNNYINTINFDILNNILKSEN